jgi:iron complex transport system substrate-binding protein
MLTLLALLLAQPTLLGPTPPAAVNRVVTLAPSLTDAVLVVAPDAGVLVGVSRFDEAAEVTALPRVGGFNDPSVEAVLALRPDVVLAQHSPGNRGPVETLGRAGVAVVSYRLTSVGDVELALRDIGRLLGKAQAGEAAAQRLVQTRVEVRERAAQRKPRTALLVYGFQPLVVAGPGSFAHELLSDAGLRNLAGKARTAYPTYSLERAVAMRPEIVIDASDSAEGRDRVMRLLKSSRVVKLPSTKLLRPGPALTEGLLELESATTNSLP